MTSVFADAGYWIALLNPTDALHERAVQVSASLGHTRILTSEFVLTEVLNACARKGDLSRMTACVLIDRIRSNPNSEIVPMTSSAFRQALDRYRRRADKTWGLTDCASFLIMEEKGITDALSADRDFQQAGFKALLLDVDRYRAT
jgi:predicted nucleic acid-binding protein